MSTSAAAPWPLLALPRRLRVVGLWRYPVKSLQGQLVRRLALDERGVVGDRRLAVVDAATGAVLSAKREPRLLLARAQMERRGGVLLRLPDGRTMAADDPAASALLSSWLGRDVRVDAAASDAVAFADDAAVHVLTTASLRRSRAVYADGDWDPRRFRPTLLLDGPVEGFAEDAWPGRTLAVGAVRLGVVAPTVRCAMVAAAQPGLPADGAVLRTLARIHGSSLGVYAVVRRGGRVALGASATLEG